MTEDDSITQLGIGQAPPSFTRLFPMAASVPKAIQSLP